MFCFATLNMFYLLFISYVFFYFLLLSLIFFQSIENYDFIIILERSAAYIEQSYLSLFTGGLLMKRSPSPLYLTQRIRKSRILSGALLLTAAGIISRIIGFFYRIFLSRTFGAENIGIYQLISPVMALAYSISVAGFQTAISRITATTGAVKSSPDFPAAGRKKVSASPDNLHSYTVLATGMLLSLLLSFGISCFVYLYCEEIAVRFLLEERCAPLLKILALSFPVSSIHSCVSGYFYGKKSAGFPAFSQLFEQLVRVGSVLFLCRAFLLENPGSTPDISFAVAGMVMGEIASAILSLLYLWHCFKKTEKPARSDDFLPDKMPAFSILALFPELFMMAVPLSAGRVIQNLLQSIEAIAIPDKLRLFGLDTASALSEYGILTGMSLPFILFPTALTGSIAVMLLPTVSEAQALHQERTIARAVHRSVHYCLLLGFFCLGFFLLFGPALGKFVFHQEQAGSYLQILGFMCPFLYMNSTLSSILHGLGKTMRSFFYGVASLLVRLAFVFFCIPVFGIKGYLWALLASQLLLAALQLLSLRKYLNM